MMFRLKRVSTDTERAFEKRHIGALRDRYLSMDAAKRVREDAAYRQKVETIRSRLPGDSGVVLDIGANTCGESQYLAEEGFDVIAADINEVALGTGRERSRLAGLRPLNYVACNGEEVALRDGSVDFVVVIEALHHMDRPEQTAREVSRVLKPGGLVVMYEPYAYNPYRRLSEIRDYFRGTKEYSFSVRKLKRLFGDAGMEPVRLDKVVLPPKKWNAKELGAVHRFLRAAYHRVSLWMPWMFGALLYVAQKPGVPGGVEKKEAQVSRGRPSFESMLRCPITHSPVIETPEGFVSSGGGEHYLYPSHSGIPVLVRTDAKALDADRWRALSAVAQRSPA